MNASQKRAGECSSHFLAGSSSFSYYFSSGIDLLVKDPKPECGDRFPFKLEFVTLTVEFQPANNQQHQDYDIQGSFPYMSNGV